MNEFGFNTKLPQYYTPDAVLIETLRVCIDEKQRSPNELKNISDKIRGGMNKDKFNTNFSK